MTGWLMWILSFVCGLTFTEFVKGLFINLVSDILYDTGKLAVTFFKGNMEVEEQLKACFYKAVDKNIKNDQISKYVREHDYGQYLDALKKELMSDEVCFKKDSNYALILEDFKKELFMKPIFTMQLIKMYGKELCQTTDDTLKKVNELIEKSKEQERRQAAIQETLLKICARQGYTLAISDSRTGAFECPIPDQAFNRKLLVSQLTIKLQEKGCLYIYGGFRTGKSVISCQIAKTLAEYEKIRIQLDYRNVYSIREIVENFGEQHRTVFLIDGLEYKEESIIKDLCQYIVGQDKSKRLFILNGRIKLSSYTTEMLSIEELEIPTIDADDICDVIPDKNKGLSSAIYAMSDGNPWVALMMIELLNQKGWPENEDALWTLFKFGEESSLGDKMRRILTQLVPNRNALMLLNRMLLVKNKISKELCRQLAAVEPVISMPDTCLDELSDSVITIHSNGEIDINPAFKKTLVPDLIANERIGCNTLLAEQITSRRNLDEMDVTHVITYLLDAEDYNKAGNFFLSCLLALNPQEADKFTYLASIWADMKLPEQMAPMLQLLIRVQQVLVFGRNHKRYMKFQIDDLERLSNQYQERDIAKNFALQLLYMYYGMAGNNDKAIRIYQQIKEIKPSAENYSLLEDNIWIALYGSTSEKEIEEWIETYEKDGSPDYDFLEEISNQAVTNVRMKGNEEDIEQSLFRIKDYVAKKGNEKLYGFIVAAETNLIMLYGLNHDFKRAIEVYENSSYHKTEFGKLMLNFSMGLSLYNAGKKNEAQDYLAQAVQTKNIRISSVNVLYAHIYYAAILMEERKDEALAVLSELLNNPDFVIAYTEDEKVLMYGEIGMAYWNNDKRAEAIAQFLKVEDYLWKNRENMDGLRLRIFMALSTCMANYYGCVRALPIPDGGAVPNLTMFILERPGINEYYSDFQEMAVRYYLYYLQKEYLWVKDLSLGVLDRSLSYLKASVLKSKPECITLVLECIPDLLCQYRFDDVIYIVNQSAKAVKEYNAIVKHPEGAIMLPALVYTMLYRLERQMREEPFDETMLERALCDFIAYHPQDCEFTKFFLSVVKGEENVIINSNKDEYCVTILLLYKLREKKTSQWFVAIQRLFVQLYEYNKSNYCGQFLGKVATSMFEYLLTMRPADFDLERKDKVLYSLNKYEGYNRVRSVLSGMHHLLKVSPPTLPPELEEIMDLSIDIKDLKK